MDPDGLLVCEDDAGGDKQVYVSGLERRTRCLTCGRGAGTASRRRDPRATGSCTARGGASG